jgi:hypothetical protein
MFQGYRFGSWRISPERAQLALGVYTLPSGQKVNIYRPFLSKFSLVAATQRACQIPSGQANKAGLDFKTGAIWRASPESTAVAQLLDLIIRDAVRKSQNAKNSLILLINRVIYVVYFLLYNSA